MHSYVIISQLVSRNTMSLLCTYYSRVSCRVALHWKGLVEGYFFNNMTPNFMGHFYVTVTPNIMGLSYVLSFMGLSYVPETPNVMGLSYVE